MFVYNFKQKSFFLRLFQSYYVPALIPYSQTQATSTRVEEETKVAKEKPKRVKVENGS